MRCLRYLKRLFLKSPLETYYANFMGNRETNTAYTAKPEKDGDLLTSGWLAFWESHPGLPVEFKPLFEVAYHLGWLSACQAVGNKPKEGQQP
jgi:hypothetical protein